MTNLDEERLVLMSNETTENEDVGTEYFDQEKPYSERPGNHMVINCK